MAASGGLRLAGRRSVGGALRGATGSGLVTSGPLCRVSVTLVVLVVLFPSAAVAAAVGGQPDGGSSAVAAAGGFSDVGEDGFHSEAIGSLAVRGVFEGTECAPGKFCPTDPVERWVMAVWLVRILDGADPAALDSSRFADVDASEWWAPYVERLADLAVTKGCSTEPARFCPGETVTRAQMASFLVRAFGLPGGRSGRFSDTGGVHEPDIDALAAAGVTAGCATSPRRYCPDRDTSRAEMATFLTRALAVDPRPEHVVRVLYAVPADREFRSADRGVIRRAVEHVQSWYHHQLGGMTFSLHDPIVEDCRMSRPEDFYARGDAWQKVVEGVQHCASAGSWPAGGTYDNPRSTTTWVIYADVEEACDEYHRLGEAGHELGRGGWGLTIMGRQEGVFDSGPYRYCGEGPYWRSRGGVIGGIAHELTHALGVIDHPPGCDEGLPSCDYPALMSVGYTAYPDTYLRDDEKAILRGSPFITRRPVPLPPLVDIPSAIRGVIVDPDGRPVDGVGLWAWQIHNTENSRFGRTGSDGTFVIRVPDGPFRLDVYAAPEGTCAGYYDGESITANRQEAVMVTVEGTDVEGITIRLPAPPEDLPTIQC